MKLSIQTVRRYKNIIFILAGRFASSTGVLIAPPPSSVTNIAEGKNYFAFDSFADRNYAKFILNRKI